MSGEEFRGSISAEPTERVSNELFPTLAIPLDKIETAGQISVSRIRLLSSRAKWALNHAGIKNIKDLFKCKPESLYEVLFWDGRMGIPGAYRMGLQLEAALELEEGDTYKKGELARQLATSFFSQYPNTERYKAAKKLGLDVNYESRS